VGDIASPIGGTTDAYPTVHCAVPAEFCHVSSAPGIITLGADGKKIVKSTSY
jgi:hypothetical protein